MECIDYKQSSTSSGGEVTVEESKWDIHSDDTFKCVTENQNYVVKSYDYDLQERKPTFKASDYKTPIDLGKIFGNNKYKIGEPRRLIAFFQDSHTASTIACEKSSSGNQWVQQGESVKSCNSLQNPKPLVDIIFVIDNSGSMKNNQVALSRSVSNFTDRFFEEDAENINFSITVATTDRKGFNPLLKKDLNKTWTLSQLENYMKPGTGGSGHERSLSQLGSTLNNYSRYNRDLSYLAVFFITDEDHYDNEGNASSSRAVQIIDSLKGNNREKIIVHGALNNGSGAGVRRFINTYNGEVFDVDNLAGYGDGMRAFAESIVSQILVLGN